ncbi:MAG: DMT family transporter [Akkermansiaceae bacterium]|nr:DMT family transporter [Armatimonadota bacterium]
MPETSERRALFLAVLTMLTWGAAGSFVRLLAERLAITTPFVSFAVLGGRLAASFVFLMVLLIVFQGRQLRGEILPALRLRETWIAGGFQFLYYLFAVVAFTIAPISEIALCASTAPLWVLLIRRLRAQPVSSSEIFGAAVALTGVALIVLPNVLKQPLGGAPDAFPHRIWGNLLSLASAVVTAVYALFQRRYTLRGRPIEPRALSLIAFGLGLPLVFFLRPASPAILVHPTTVWLFTGLALVTTVLPTLAFAFASRRLPPVTTATVALLLPVFATSYAAIVLKEIPSWLLFPGGILVLCGLGMILRRTNR